MAASVTWRVVTASFETSADSLSACPNADLPEFAACGRSNVGKSNLFNALVGHGGLARVSKTPGRTQLLNFFRLRLRSSEGSILDMRWADLPGYGYASASKATRDTLQPLISSYVQGRKSLSGLVLLVDSRRDVDPRDCDMLSVLAKCEIPVLIAATKTDKIGASKRGLVARQLATALDIPHGSVLLTSSTTGAGIHDAPGQPGLVGEIAGLLL